MKRIGLFFGVSLVILFLADRVGGYLLDLVYNRTFTGQTGGKINHYLSLPETPNLLIMGNSRALYQIIPDSFPSSAYNLCHAGMGPSFQAGLLAVLAKKEKLPKLILLHVEPSDYTIDQRNLDIQNLKFFYHDVPEVRAFTNDVSPYEKYKFIFSLYRYNGRVIPLVKNFFQTKRLTLVGNGYDALPATSTDSLNTLYSYQKVKHFVEPRFNASQFRFLDIFLTRCRESSTAVVVFTSPFFRNLNPHPVAVGELKKYFQSKGVPYLFLPDLLDPDMFENPKLWRDAYHVNHDGAQLESALLAKHLRALTDKL